MTRTVLALLPLLPLAPVANAQESDRLAAAKRGVVGVTARRTMTMEIQGRTLPRTIDARQVGIVLSDDGVILTASLGVDPQDIRVFVPGTTEGLDAEVLDSDEVFTVLHVGEGPYEPVRFQLDWQPAVGQKLIWIGLLASSQGSWTPIAKEAQVDALLPDEATGLAQVYSDPPFTGPVSNLCSLVLDGSGRAVGVVLPLPAEGRAGPDRRGPLRAIAGTPVVRGAGTFAQYLGGEITRRGVLGVSVEPLGEKVAEALGMKGTRGVLVTQVNAGSGAAKAGIAVQDVLTRVGDTPVTSPVALREALRGKAAGTSVEVHFVRVSAEGPMNETATVMLGESEGTAKRERYRAPRFGVVLEPIPAAFRTALEIPEDIQGLLVRRVTPGSPASLGRPSPLQQGDLLLKAGDRSLPDLATAKEILEAAPNGTPITFFVRTGRETRFVEVTPEEAGGD